MAEASQKLNMFWFLTISIVATLLVGPASGQLSPGFYGGSCPSVLSTVRSIVTSAVGSDGRIGASLLRMHFHDCFVLGCEASVLLDDIPSAGLQGEKNIGANAGSLRGFEVIDSIKSALETQCPGTVSCADILAIAARDGVVLAGGPSWNVELGRRDGTSASAGGVGANLPGPGSSASQIIAQFGARGLDTTDAVALSGIFWNSGFLLLLDLSSFQGVCLLGSPVLIIYIRKYIMEFIGPCSDLLPPKGPGFCSYYISRLYQGLGDPFLQNIDPAAASAMLSQFH